MPRPRRATDCRLHHVTTRANNRRPMYEDVEDRETFYGVLERGIERSAVLCHLDVLMGNHYHLVLEGPIAAVSELMWHVNYRYTLAYNARHERINHLCGRRFYCTSIADRHGFRAVSVYVALNPVRAGICSDPREWPYGAFRAYAGIEEPRAHLTTTLVQEAFAAVGGLVEACDAALKTGRPGRPSLAKLLPSRRVVTRQHVTQAIKVFGYTHAEIARHYRVSQRTLNRWLEIVA